MKTSTNTDVELSDEVKLARERTAAYEAKKKEAGDRKRMIPASLIEIADLNGGFDRVAEIFSSMRQTIRNQPNLQREIDELKNTIWKNEQITKTAVETAEELAAAKTELLELHRENREQSRKLIEAEAALKATQEALQTFAKNLTVVKASKEAAAVITSTEGASAASAQVAQRATTVPDVPKAAQDAITAPKKRGRKPKTALQESSSEAP